VEFLLELVIDILASWGRLFVALFLSIIFSIVVGIWAATSKKAESIVLPIIDVLQTLPILAFFPVVIYLIVLVLPNYIGINLSVIFLIFTSMSWNITFGVYEAVKAIPSDFKELVELNHISGLGVVKELYIPAAMPGIAYQSMVSWAVGLFYLVTSEIFSTGSKNFAVTYGIGAEIAKLVLANNPLEYATMIFFLIIAILLTIIFFLHPFSVYAERFSFAEQKSARKSKILAFYSRIGGLLRKLLPKFKLQETSKNIKPIQTYETKQEKPERKSNATLLFVLLLCIIFALATIITNSYSYLGDIAIALASSFARVWSMYCVCMVIAVIVGIKIAKSERIYAPALAVLQVIAAIPATILLPAIVAVLYLLPFGNELTALAIIFLSMIWYLLFSVVSGMRTLPIEFKEIVGIFRMKWTDAWKDVYIPAILPSLVTGSIAAIGGAWNALIIAEYFSIATSGGSAASCVTCNTTLNSTSTAAMAPANTIVLTQVNSGVGKLLDIATFKGDFLDMGLVLIAMTIMIVLVNRFVWQELYKRVTLKYRMDV
jgi:NitT/TauT family transport system permease protein